ncbi:putative deoxyribonuclease TATDN3 [Pecten maximus]|uniref:putative deoxyribonuclease TATDN3 n=1 Tax=Pecten maximus TaxID=6579 RepID=UPI001457FE04|nr:putative deoxyribonuclease TATDN3 [Pecten maximus]
MSPGLLTILREVMAGVETDEADSPSPGFAMVDCHCHLVDKAFDEDIDTVIQQAKQAGVKGALVVTETYTQFDKVLQLAQRHPDFVFPCLGVHPVQGALTGDQRCVTLEDVEKAIPIIEKNISHIAAIGEIGLDFQPRICVRPEDKDIQRQVLKMQVDLAKKYDLPVNVHSRSAGRPTIAALREYGADKVLLHAFDGKPAVAMAGVEAGYFFSIPPSCVRNPESKLVHRLPITNILLESDSPALGPEKDVRNEPKNISLSCDYIATRKKLDVQELSRITTMNALRLFPKLARVIK